MVNDEPALAYSEPQGRLFVYNAADKATGFVIIAGSSLLDDPVLGYTESGAFDSNNLPCNFEWWLESTARYIEALESGLITPPVSYAPSMARSTDVSNFLKSTWDQTSPYNDKCPSGCVTGCVATALAQVLYYYKQPTSTKKVIPAWTDGSGHSFSAIPSGTSLNLNSCTDTYTSSSTTTAKNAVANLMQYCGQAVKMEWGSSSSSSQGKAIAALHEFFGYSHYVRDIPYYTDYISQEQMKDVVYTEIVAKRPVMLSAGSGSAGHVFLCSGYQKSSDKFWINWGWGGSNDGWFSLYAMQGGGMTWNLAHVVIGLQPDGGTGAPSYPLAEILYPIVNSSESYPVTITRSSSSSAFTSSQIFQGSFGLGSVYDSYGTVTFDVCYGIYKQDGTRLATFAETNSWKTLEGMVQDHDFMYMYYNYNTQLTISSSIPNGTYYIYPLCRKNGTSTWYRMFMSNIYNLKLVVNGNTATITQGPFTGHDGYEGGSSTPETDTTAPTFSGSISTNSITSSSVALSWSKASDNVTAQANLLYQVQYKKSSASSWTTAKSYTANITSFTVTGLSASTAYNFRVTVKDEAGNTTYKDASATTSSAADTTPPTFSGSISTNSITSSSVALSWSKASDNVTAQANLLYQVQYKKSSASSWTTAKSYTANITSFTVTGLSASTTYNFRVTVKDEAGNTTYKDVNATTSSAADTTPPTFSGGLGAAVSTSSVILSWNHATDNVTAWQDITYKIEYKKNSSTTWTVKQDYRTFSSYSYTINGLESGTKYDFRVTAKDEAGNTTSQTCSATTEAASTTVDYGINIAGTQLTSTLLKPGYGHVIDGYMIGVGGSIDAFLNTAGDEVTIYLDNIYCSSTAMMPLLTCDGNGADRIKKIVLNVKGNNYFETSDYQAVTVKDANLRIQGTGTLNLTSPYDAIWIATGGKCEIGDEVKLKCSGSVGGNGYGEHNETLVIGEHAYVEVNNGWVQRLAAITLNDNIALIYPGLSKAMVGNQWDGSYTSMGVGVVKTLYIPSVNAYQSTGEVYGDGIIVFGENYDVAINNTRVNAYNASDVLGDGKVTYDPFNHELTLKNVNITMDGVVYMGYDYCSTAIINSWGDEDFALRFEGENTLNVNAYNNDFPVLYATNPRVMIYGHSAKLNCSARRGTEPFGVVFKAAKSLEFWDGEVTTMSGSSAVEGTTSNAILVVAGGSKLDMKSSWGQGTVNASTGETTFDAAVMLQNVSQLQLMDYRVIVNPKGGYFKPSLGSITVDGTTPYKGEVLIGDESLGIESIENTPLTVDRYYTLDGRVMQGAPTQKGVYIINGKKVVIK